MKIIPVIMAGGAGTRLWPLSQQNYPKQFLKIFDGKSLFQLCLERNSVFGQITTIVTLQYRFIALEQANEISIDVNIIAEPCSKNTAPCAILSCLLPGIMSEDIILLLPADHCINDLDSYISTVKEAAELASNYSIATIGVNPTTPNTDYGYIESSVHINHNSFLVNQFIEKPDMIRATKYLESKKYLWNSGIFLFRPEEMSKIARDFLPDMTEHVFDSLAKAQKDSRFLILDSDSYNGIRPLSIDYGIMEKTKNITVTKASFGWTDLGSFSSIWQASEKDKNQNVKLGDNILLLDSSNNLVYSDNKLIALAGVSDLIVVNTEDKILVAHKSKSDDIKKFVNIHQSVNLTKSHLDSRNGDQEVMPSNGLIPGRYGKQVLLTIGPKSQYSVDDYYISTSNKLAYEACFNKRIGLLPYDNILLILGPESCGKSFLAYFIAEKLSGVIVKSVTDIYIESNLYILDDADLLEEELVLHIFNIAKESCKNIIFLSKNDWTITLPDLKSRINSLKQVSIEQADDYIVEIILLKEFSKRSLEVNKQVLNYLKPRLERNFAQIIKTIDSINKYCMENKKNLSVKTVSEWMSIRAR